MALKLAIVGRPNVGKSTLFNRLAGRKLAIVDDRPGVTRDRRFATGRLGDLDLELIDTAGFEDVEDESLEARMRHQTELAIEEADLSIVMIDAREGVVPLDEVFAKIIRKRDKPVLVVANKAEGKAGQSGIAEAWRLGLGEPIAISAEHGEGLAELYAAVAVFADRLEPRTAPEDEPWPDDALSFETEEDEADDDKPIRIAVVGRPNAGKSTLVNRLIGEDRMLTGPEAGITRDSISVEWEWEGRKVRLVDTAGMRRKAKVNEKLERLSVQDSLRAITFAEVVLLIMDADHAFDTQDLQLADLVEREGRALVFVIAKWDLVTEPQARLAELIEGADRLLPQVRGTPLIALSAHTGRGLDRLMPGVFKAHRNWSAKVKTRDLNDWLQIMVQRHPPPAVAGKRVKPKYMAQTKGRPPTFVLFASRATQMPDSYKRYLVNGLRESFDLPGVPIRLTVKAGKNPYAEGEGAGGESRQRGGPKAGYKPTTKREGRVRAKPVGTPKAKPYAGPSKPKVEGKASGKPVTKAHGKPGGRSSAKPAFSRAQAGAGQGRPGGKPAGRAAPGGRGKPAGRPGGGRGKPTSR